MKPACASGLLAVMSGALIFAASMIQARAADDLGKDAWGFISPKGAAELAPGGQVLHITVHHPSAQYFATQLTHDVAAQVAAGKVLVYSFSARSATSNSIHAVIEKRAAPYTHYLDKVLTLTPEWKTYRLTTKIPEAQAKRELAARLQVGQKAGTLDFKDIALSSE